MHAHPLFRPLAAATLIVVLTAAIAFGFAPAGGATLEGAALALVQRAENAPATARVVWVTGDAAGDAGKLRGDVARAVDAAARGGARAIVLALPVAEPSDSADLARVRSFLDSADSPPDAAMRARLQAWEAELDHDSELERALRAAGNVVLLAAPAAAPLERFASAARGVGTEPAAAPDADGVSRRDRLYASEAAGAPAPSLSFLGWLVAHGKLGADAPTADGAALAAAVRLRAGSGGSWIPHYGRRATEQGGTARVSLRELAANRVPAARFAGQIVVIGDGPGTLVVPTGAGLTLGEALAQRIDSLETDSYAVVPRLARLATALALLAVIAYAGVLAPRLAAPARFGFALLLALGLLVLELVLLAEARLWVPLTLAAVAAPLATLAGALMPEPAAPRVARREPVVPRPAAPLPRPAEPPRAPPRGGKAPEPPPPEPDSRSGPASLRQISDTLEARAEEPSQADVADVLLGRSKRPQRPRLGRYELERELGRGAMGTVYLGRDPRINRVVAIKAIPIVEEFTETELAEARARFFREAEMAGRLRHPGIVTVYDAGEDGGIAWIAMEYLQGEILSQYTVAERLLPPATVLEVVARIADALDYAHSQDIVHRDIKPANVLYDPASRQIKITDFGIARLTNTSATRSGIVLGTPSFMAPEQLEGRNVTGRSDLFALGVTLFQLLAGQLPFRADSMTGLMYKIANSQHPPLKTIRPDLPPCVTSIIDKSLQKDPAQRYATGAEMARALRACARSVSA
ncbi:MAG TPA: protein kinase [Steroidobacteraceae bacterium]|nr:protein kinase [Steroidobacteraceae bacterium]